MAKSYEEIVEPTELLEHCDALIAEIALCLTLLDLSGQRAKAEAWFKARFGQRSLNPVQSMQRKPRGRHRTRV